MTLAPQPERTHYESLLNKQENQYYVESPGKDRGFFLEAWMSDTDALIDDLVRRLPMIRALQDGIWKGEPQPRDTRLPVDELVTLVKQTRDIEIDIRLVPFTARHLVSLVERQTEQQFLVAVREDAPLVERRYGVVKELCHIIGDEPADYQPHGERTLDGIMRVESAHLYDKTLDLGGDRPAVQSEKRAERMADELIYDRRLRLEDMRRSRSQETTIAAMASAYGVPQLVMTRVFRPLAQGLTHDLWRKAGYEEPL